MSSNIPPDTHVDSFRRTYVRTSRSVYKRLNVDKLVFSAVLRKIDFRYLLGIAVQNARSKGLT